MQVHIPNPYLTRLLDADYRFACAQPAKWSGLGVRLFEAFPRLRRIDAQMVSGKGLSSKSRFLNG